MSHGDSDGGSRGGPAPSGRREESPAQAPSPDEPVLLGRVGRAFGLNGEVRFRPLGPSEAAAIFELEEVSVEERGPVMIRNVRRHGEDILLSLQGVRDREAARKLVNSRVFAQVEHLPAVDEGQAFLDRLVGSRVSVDGRPLGEVSEVRGVAGAELLVVDRVDGGQELLPLNAPYVATTPAGVEVTDPPPGLVDLPEDR